MTPHEYSMNWRQIRLFIPNPNEFLSFHFNHTLPLVQGGGLETSFFISHYSCTDEEDPADTEIANLPQHFRYFVEDPQNPGEPRKNAQGNPAPHHASIRFRWREDANGTFEQQITNIIPANCWYSDFREFTMPNGMAHGRFSDYPTADIPANESRAQMIGEILHFNSRLLLDSLRTDANGTITLEASNDALNWKLQSPLHSVIHMIANAHLKNHLVGF